MTLDDNLRRDIAIFGSNAQAIDDIGGRTESVKRRNIEVMKKGEATNEIVNYTERDRNAIIANLSADYSPEEINFFRRLPSELLQSRVQRAFPEIRVKAYKNLTDILTSETYNELIKEIEGQFLQRLLLKTPSADFAEGTKYREIAELKEQYDKAKKVAGEKDKEGYLEILPEGLIKDLVREYANEGEYEILMESRAKFMERKYIESFIDIEEREGEIVGVLNKDRAIDYLKANESSADDEVRNRAYVEAGKNYSNQIALLEAARRKAA